MQESEILIVEPTSISKAKRPIFCSVCFIDICSICFIDKYYPCCFVWAALLTKDSRPESFVVFSKGTQRCISKLDRYRKVFISFVEHLLSYLGVALTDWLANCLPEDWAGDLRELHREFSSNGNSSLTVLLRVLGAGLIRLWSALLIFLKGLMSSDEELVAWS